MQPDMACRIIDPLTCPDFLFFHGESFHRIKSAARMKDGALRVFDLTDPHIRETIKEAEDTPGPVPRCRGQ